MGNLTTKKEEFDLMSKIAKRAVRDLVFKDRDVLGLVMDLEFIHEQIPLNLEGLLTARLGDFAHDINGIYYNFNRQTKTMDNCFLPRYSI